MKASCGASSIWRSTVDYEYKVIEQTYTPELNAALARAVAEGFEPIHFAGAYNGETSSWAMLLRKPTGQRRTDLSVPGE